MKKIIKTGYLKFLAIVLSVALILSAIPVIAGTAAETDSPEQTDTPAADNGLNVTMKANKDGQISDYDGEDWVKGDVNVEITTNKYFNISDVKYKKNTDSNWISVSDVTNGKASTDDEAGSDTVIRFTISSVNNTYGGSYDLSFINGENTEPLVFDNAFSVMMDNSITTFSAGKEPERDIWEKEVKISGTAIDTDSGVNSLQYTIDGVNYNNVVVKENGSFEINLTNNYKGNVDLICEDKAGNTNKITVKNIQIDTVAPVISKIDPDSVKWTNNSVEITVQATDELSGVKEVRYCEVKKDSEVSINPKKDPIADVVKENSKYKFTLNKDKNENFEGSVIIYAIDNAGNNSFDNDIKTLSVNFDTQQCVVTSISVDKTDWTNEEINLNVKIEDNLSGVKTDSVKYNVYPEGSVLSEDKWLEAKEKEGEPGTFTAVINKDRSLESGKYLVAVQAEDNAGNGSTIDETKAEVNYPLSVFIDNTAPVFNGDIKVYKDSWYKDSWTNGKVTISGNVTDTHSDVSKVKYKRASEEAWQNVDVLPDENGNFSFSVEAEPNEVYSGKYKIIAYDNAGGENTEISNYTEAESPEVKLDKSKPEIKCNYSEAEPAQKIEISGTATDTGSEISVVKYRKHGESDFNNEAKFDANTNTYSFVIESDYNGKYYIVAYDKAGNESKIVTTENISVDVTPPTVDDVQVEFTESKGTDRWTNKDIVFTVTASDEKGASRSGVDVVKYSFADNDNYPKDVDVEANKDGKFTFTIKADDLSIGKGKDGGYAGEIFIYAVDKAGNISDEQGSKSIDIKIDTEKGKADIVATTLPVGWQNDSVSVEVNFIDINDKKPEYISGFSKIEYMKKDFDGAVVQDWTELSKQSDSNNYCNSEEDKYTLTFEKTNFNGTYYVRFVDKAGNISNEISFDAKQDKEEPEIESATVKNTDWTNGKVEIEVKAKDIKADPLNYNSGIKSISFKKSTDDDTNWTEITNIVANETKKTAQFTIELPEQNYYGKYDIKCTDNADNDSTVFTTTEVKQDIIAPVLTVDNENMGNNDWTKELVTFTGAVSDNLSGVKAVEYRHIYSDGTNEKWQSAEYKTDNNGLTGEFQFNLEHQDFSGYIEIRCVDKAGNNDYESEAEITKRWVNMDITAPEIKVKHSEPISVWEDVLNAITFGSFNYHNPNDPNANNLAFELTITDNLSGIDFNTLTIHYYKNGVEVKDKIKDIIDNSYLSNYSRDDNELNAYNQPISSIVKFTINDKLNINSHIWFTVDDNVMDNANSSTNTSSDSIDTMIVDTIAPEIGTIEYSGYENSTDETIDKDTTLYYKNYAEISLDFIEANFYSEDVEFVLTKDGEEIPCKPNWKDHKAVVKFGSTYVTNGSYDGTYVLSVKYSDRSKNEMTEFTSAKIVLDNTAPKRVVSYSQASRAVDTSTMNDVDFNNTAEGTDTTLFYKDKAVLNFDMEETYFFGEEVYVTITKDNKNYSYDLLSWKDNSNHHTVELVLDEEGVYEVSMKYTDRSNNSMKDYQSAKIVVDKTAPKLSVSYSNKDVKNTINGVKYFDNTQTATITITEKNFRADDVNVKVTAKNSSGNDVSVTDYASYLKNRSNWKTVGDVHTATITYDKDSNYTFDIEYQDLAKNSIADYSEDRFTVDKTAPQSVNISYSQSVLAKVVNAISFNYYNAPVTVDLSCYDETSGVYSFDYEGIIAADASAVNKAVVKTAIDNAQITSANGTYTARFTIPQSALTALNSFNGTLTVDATDCSSNSIKNEDSRRIVADNIAPTGSVELNTPSGTSGNVSYYSGNITGTFTINEANFYPEDVDFRIDGSVQSLSWSNNGDTHTASFTITSEGEHSFTLNYADRSGNKMNAITRNNLVIDKTIPSIVVDKSIKNTSANNAKTITFKLSVDDKYFDASGINAKLVANVTKASDENPDEKISKLVEEEVDLGSPSKVGTTYVYIIENVSTDGFYTLTCTARDYAGNENSKISCTESDDKTADVDGFNFSVNRNGSSFWVESSVDNDAYTNSNKISVALHEINVDEISSDATLRIANDNNTETVKLNDTNYSKNKKVGKTGWYESVYTLNNSYFEKDSAYSVALTTHDRAGNISKSTDSDVSVINFTVDRTAPVISSNISNGQTINANDFDVEIKVAENNIDLKTMKVMVNGKSVDWKNNEDNNSYTFNLKSGDFDKYNIEIAVDDLAENASGSYTVSDVTVSTNQFVLILSNPATIWIAIAVLVLVIGITVFILLSKKRKKAKEA